MHQRDEVIIAHSYSKIKCIYMEDLTFKTAVFPRCGSWTSL
jgi:hypothetical protein